MRRQLLFLILLSTLLPNAVYASEYMDYLSEFNTSGEICVLEDHFYYIDINSITTRNIIFSCCKESECIELPFDIHNLRKYQKSDLKEIFEAKHVRKQMSEEKISPSNYPFGGTFNSCDYFGFDSLQEESLNFANEASEKSVHHLPKNAQKIVIKASKTAKSLGLVKSFSPATFVTSIVCTGFFLEKEKDAIEQVGICNQYMENLKQGNAYYGVANDLLDCNIQASAKLKTIRDSPLMQIKGGFDTVGNAIGGIFSWALSGDPLNNELVIPESTYDLMIEAHNKISKEYESYENPFSDLKSDKAIFRFDLKNKEAVSLYSELDAYQKKLELGRATTSNELFTYLFMNPNYNYTEFDNRMLQTESSLNRMQQYIHTSRYNSAVGLHHDINNSLALAEVDAIKEAMIEREWDILPILLVFILSGGLIYVIIRYQKREKNYV